VLAQLQKLHMLSLHGVKLELGLRDAFEAIAQVKSLRFVMNNFLCVLSVTYSMCCYCCCLSFVYHSYLD